MNNHRFIFGCGYVGYRLAVTETQLGHPVTALVRSEEKFRELSQQGINCVKLDLDQPLDDIAIDTTNAVTHYHVPPSPQGQQDSRIRNFFTLLEHSGLPQRIVLISTSGVYGNTDGRWVNESSPVNPSTDRAIRRLDAEQTASAWCQDNAVSLVILRVPGIYGPGRTPEARLANPVINKAEAPYSNRIHVDDLVTACVKAGTIENPLPIYNVVDDQPSTMTDYFNAVADHAGLPRPPVISMAEAQHRLSPAMLSYLGESRRIENAALRDHLGVALRFPNLKAGLAHCFKRN